MKNRYTEKQIIFLRKGFARMGIPELTCAFNKKFGLNKSAAALKTAMSSRKITCGRTTGALNKGRSTIFSAAQIKFIKTKYLLFGNAALTVLFNQKFNTAITEQQMKTFIFNHHIISGRTGCFPKGHVPVNKGTKGMCHGSCTSFKKGNVPVNIKPLGHERKDNRTDPTKTNYIWVKVAEPNPYTKAQTRYRQKHVVVWEQTHGPVPPGMVVAFKDGNSGNVVIDNLMLINRAELARLNQNHYKELPMELKPSQLALIKLKTKIFSLTKKKQSQGKECCT